MYDLWELKEWHASQSSTSVVDRETPRLPEADEAESSLDAEEMPRPFLNEYLPSPGEIRHACGEIQKEWTDAERRRRRGHRRAHRQPYTLRVVKASYAG